MAENDVMEQLRRDVSQLSEIAKVLQHLVMGDPHRPKDMPGLVNELSHLQSEVRRTNELLRQIQSGLAKIGWTVIIGVVSAVLAVVLKT